MHGGRDRNDGTRIAGTRIEIYNNTFIDKGRAIKIRGKPEEYAYIHSNWFMMHCAPSPAVLGKWPPANTVEFGENLYGTKYTVVR
jgi:hypothetical protein